MDPVLSLALPRPGPAAPDAFYAGHGPAPWQRLAALVRRGFGRWPGPVARRAAPV